MCGKRRASSEGNAWAGQGSVASLARGACLVPHVAQTRCLKGGYLQCHGVCMASGSKDKVPWRI
eukprot:1133621-Pelagomonas_calceolata.AAC.12